MSASMTDIELIGYCEIHCTTERALFAAEHVNRMIELAGDPPGFHRKNGWVSAHGEMQELCDLARARLAPPAAAITPPVAAGSVDTTEFKRLCNALYLSNPPVREGERLRMVAHIDAWGAQQREAGRMAEMQSTMNMLQAYAERAEKADADLKQANEWRNAALQENMRLADVWMDRVTRSEARVKELEAEDLAMHRKLAAEKLRADQGWARYEAANRAKNELEKKLADVTPYALKA